jgi:NAD(P)-dependent dehydrogenase (short-subunit alcohol dehydrogenase family)
LFAARGAKRIAIVGRNIEKGNSARARVGAECVFLPGDANTPNGARDIISRAEERLGPVDALVTSTAGAALPALLKDIAIEDVPSTLIDQALGPLLMARAVLESMRARKSGSIVSIASDAGKVATPGETVIGAAMAAIIAFSRAMAMECKRDGIRVNVATPSLIEGTPIYDRLMQDPFSTALFTKAAKLAHLGVAQPSDLAELVVFLSSNAASKITGQAISANGGISAA